MVDMIVRRGRAGVARETKTKYRIRVGPSPSQHSTAPSTPTRATTSSPASKPRPGAPRSLILTTLACLLVALGMLAWDLTESWRSGPPSVSGRIVRPTTGGIGAIDPTTGTASELVRGEGNAAVTAVAWSPDRSKLAYTVFHRRPEDRISSAELYVVPASGGSPTLVVPRDQPGSIVDAPVWSPDGQSIYFAYQGVENGKPVGRVERVTIADGSRQRLYSDASFPTTSSDGRSLAFVYDNGSGQSLRIGSVDGGDAKEIVPLTAFAGVAGPRFSPDGSRIAFVAFKAGQTPAGDASPPALGLLDTLLGVRVAEAHGIPWGVWTVRPDGSELRTASSLTEDEPLLAWSPDGASLTVNGSGGLWIVDMRGTTDPRRIADGGVGAPDW
jgi:Tol biopolymer transport system component